MKKLLRLSGILCLFAFPISLQAVEKATAHLIDTKGEPVGTATFTEGASGVQLDLDASNLPPGLHGFHIYRAGSCQLPDFKSAGQHFNPRGTAHGLNNPMGHHVGDLENLNVGLDGKVKIRVLVPGATLQGEARNSLFKVGGTSLVIHEEPDDNMSDPTGNDGARIACGVIKADSK